MNLLSEAQSYLSKPYSRIIIPDNETKTFTGLIFEFPGCIVQEDTSEKAYNSLELMALGWIETCLELGQKIPEPIPEIFINRSEISEKDIKKWIKK
jgi:predicted RNase H-like HicB family nuclease